MPDAPVKPPSKPVGLRQPCPRLAAMDCAYAGSGDTKHVSDLVLRHFAFEFADAPDIGFGQLGAHVSFAPHPRSMGKLIGHVPGAGLPRKMPARDASLMTLAAFVRRVVVRCWWWTVALLTDKARNRMHQTVGAVHPAVPRCAPPERPDQAWIIQSAIVSKNDFAIEAHGRAVYGATTKRIAMSSPAFPMCAAPPAGKMRIAAIRNRAYSLGSHFDLSEGWRGQNPLGALARSAGSSFISKNYGGCHG